MCVFSFLFFVFRMWQSTQRTCPFVCPFLWNFQLVNLLLEKVPEFLVCHKYFMSIIYSCKYQLPSLVSICERWFSLWLLCVVIVYLTGQPQWWQMPLSHSFSGSSRALWANYIFYLYICELEMRCFWEAGYLKAESPLSITVLHSLELIWSDVLSPSTVLPKTFVRDIVTITCFIPQLLTEFEQHWIETKSM